MEVKINREIRNYTESMFFGLSMRQFVFSVLAILVAVGLYFLLKPHFGTETVSWMCILGAAPFAALGFITYHGMTAEQFLWAWLRSELLEPKELRFEASNLCMRSFTGFPAGAALCKVWTSCESCTGISQTSGGSSKLGTMPLGAPLLRGIPPVILLPVSTLKNSGKKPVEISAAVRFMRRCGKRSSGAERR